MLSMKGCIKKILKSCSLRECRTYTTPLVSSFYDELLQYGKEEVVDTDKYQNKIGFLQFLARGKRPDIILTVYVLSLYSSKPTSYLFKRIKRVFACWKLTKRFSLQYQIQDKSTILTDFDFDSDFAGD